MQRRKNKWGPSVDATLISPSIISNANASIKDVQSDVTETNDIYVKSVVSGLMRSEHEQGEFEINDSTFRHILIRKQTHQNIQKNIDVSIIVRGVYKPLGSPDPAPSERRLHLVVKSESAKAIHEAIDLIRYISVHGTFPNGGSIQIAVISRNEFKKVIPIGFSAEEFPGVPIVEMIVGPNNQYLKHIMDQSMTRIELLRGGISSGKPGLALGVEANSQGGLVAAESLIGNLLQSVRTKLQAGGHARTQYPPVPVMPVFPMPYPPVPQPLLPHFMMQPPPQPVQSLPYPLQAPPFPHHPVYLYPSYLAPPLPVGLPPRTAGPSMYAPVLAPTPPPPVPPPPVPPPLVPIVPIPSSPAPPPPQTNKVRAMARVPFIYPDSDAIVKPDVEKPSIDSPKTEAVIDSFTMPPPVARVAGAADTTEEVNHKKESSTSVAPAGRSVTWADEQGGEVGPRKRKFREASHCDETATVRGRRSDYLPTVHSNPADRSDPSPHLGGGGRSTTGPVVSRQEEVLGPAVAVGVDGVRPVYAATTTAVTTTTSSSRVSLPGIDLYSSSDDENENEI